MIAKSSSAQDDFRTAAFKWLAHLARSEWDAALSMLDEPNSYGILRTKDAILAIVADTFSPDSHFVADFGPPHFSDPATATGSARVNLGTIEGGSFWLDCDVPLNGTFSDLTAQFEFLARPGGFAMVLHDLHVL